MKKKTRQRPSFKRRGPNALWLLLLFALLGLGYVFWWNLANADRHSVPFSTFLTQVDAGNITRATMHEQVIEGSFAQPIAQMVDGEIRNVSNFSTVRDIAYPITKKLEDKKIAFEVYPIDTQNWSSLLFLLLMPLGLVALYMMSKQGQSGGGKIFSVGKSKARFFSPNQIKLKFKDVAGVNEAKEDLADIVSFLKNPAKFRKLGARIPQGILLTGAPGNGKTMLAKAVAGEASCPFFSASGSDFVEVFVGVGASRIRDLFAQARKHAPCIVFIDEIDSVGRSRGAGVGGGNDEREQTLNQLLAEMDGFGSTKGEVIVLAATNRPDVLDKALLRPGRFDRKVEVPFPDLVSREKILKIHSQKVPLGDDVDLKKIAQGTAQFSGADLANLINEAALRATKRDQKVISSDDFELSRDKIMVGAERTTLTRTKRDIERTAFHEAGHTLVMVLDPYANPLHKVTILSRGGALGLTWYFPEGDEVSKSEDQLYADIRVCLGGRIAEELAYGISSRTTGASSDFKKATQIAYGMVTQYGMSDLGPIVFDQSSCGYGSSKQYSEATALKIDDAASAIVQKCYHEAKQLLEENRDKLDVLTHALVEKETLDAQQVYALLELPARPSQSFVSQEPSEKVEDAKELSSEKEESQA
jgi:cell division protease FtsH